MSVMRKSAASEPAAARELRAQMQGRVVSWGDDDYARTRRVWNGAVEHQPALFAVCETFADVQAAVWSARRNVWVAKYKSGGDRSLKQTAAMWPPRVTVKRGWNS
jgi:hypothetical protein